MLYFLRNPSSESQSCFSRKTDGTWHEIELRIHPCVNGASLTYRSFFFFFCLSWLKKQSQAFKLYHPAFVCVCVTVYKCERVGLWQRYRASMCEKISPIGCKFQFTVWKSWEYIYIYSYSTMSGGKNCHFFKHCIWNNKHQSQNNSSIHLIVSSCVFYNLPDPPRGCSMERWWPSVSIKKLFFPFSSFL